MLVMVGHVRNQHSESGGVSCGRAAPSLLADSRGSFMLQWGLDSMKGSLALSQYGLMQACADS